MPLMKQIFRRVVIFFAALVVSGIVALIFLVITWNARLSHKDPGLDRESQLYADAAILAVVKTWDKDALMKRGSIELSAAARSQVDLDEVFERWRALGPMVKYNGSTGQANVIFNFETGKIVTALYAATAVFLHGSAQIKIGLVKRNGWQVASFEVYPPSRPSAVPAPPIKELAVPGPAQVYSPAPV
jgi:hypothetical protein